MSNKQYLCFSYVIGRHRSSHATEFGKYAHADKDAPYQRQNDNNRMISVKMVHFGDDNNNT